MQSARTPRFITFTSLVAGGALGLSALTGCDERGADGTLVTVQSERSTAASGAPLREEPSGAATPSGGKSADATTPETSAAASNAAASNAAAQGEAPKSDPAPKTSSVGEKTAAPSQPPTVKRLVLASRVEQREPVTLEGNATVGEPLIAFAEIVNPGEAPLDVVVTFEHASGHKVGFVELSVPPKSPRFRTWARTQNIKRAGEWHAVVTVKDGPELARQSFTVAPEVAVETPDPS